MKTKSLLLQALLLLGFAVSAVAAPETLSYSGHVTVDGQPYDGSGQFKFAFVSRDGGLTYWSNAPLGAGGEPNAAVSVAVATGVYVVILGEVSLTNMAALPASVFEDHNDVHLRVWFRAGATGNFDLLSPDQPVTSVPYAMSGEGGGGSGTTVQQTTVVEGGRVLTTGELVRLVATGPEAPSGTLILLEGDEVDVVTYSAWR